MRRLICLLFAFLVGVTLYGQSEKNVTGRVVDENGKPLKGIKLSIQYANISTKSNKNGEFLLKNVRTGDNIILEVGKNDFTQFMVGKNEKANLTLSSKSLRVETEDGQTAEYTLQPTQKDKTSGSVITAQMIERYGDNSLVNVLKNFSSGIIFETNQEGETLAYLRGKSSITLSNDALVVIDGTQMSFDQALSSVDVFDIERIEINKSGAGYGVKGGSGVIIIKTKQ